MGKSEGEEFLSPSGNPVSLCETPARAPGAACPVLGAPVPRPGQGDKSVWLQNSEMTWFADRWQTDIAELFLKH